MSHEANLPPGATRAAGSSVGPVPEPSVGTPSPARAQTSSPSKPVGKPARRPRNQVPALAQPSTHFLAAVNAAYIAAAAYRDPHVWLLDALGARLDAAVQPPCPGAAVPAAANARHEVAMLAPGLWTMLQSLFGPSGERWRVARRAFRLRYAQGIHPAEAATGAFQREIIAAEDRFWGLVYLAECEDKVRAWLLDLPADATRRWWGLVAAAAVVPARWTHARLDRLECDFTDFIMPDLFEAAASLATHTGNHPGGDETANCAGGECDVAWSRASLVESRASMPLLSQQVLLYVLTQLDPGDIRGAEWHYELRVEEFARWADLDAAAVADEFHAHGDNPADTVHHYPLVIPGYCPPGEAHRYTMETHWFTSTFCRAKPGTPVERLVVAVHRTLAPYVAWLCEQYYQAFEKNAPPTP